MDLPMPDVCPDCAAPWGWEVRPDATGRLSVQCGKGHGHTFMLTAEEALQVQLARQPDALLSRPFRFVGGPRDEPVEDWRAAPPPVGGLGTFNDAVGSLGTFNDARYRVASVDAEHVVWQYEPQDGDHLA